MKKNKPQISKNQHYKGYTIQFSKHDGVNVFSNRINFVEWHPNLKEAKNSIDKFLSKRLKNKDRI